MNDPFVPAGRTAFVAGAYGAIGEDVARSLARRGVAVALGGRDPAKLEQVAAALRADGGDARAFAFDAANVPALQAAVQDAATALGGIDLLVNAVGMFEEQRLLDATPESFDQVTDANYRAAMFLAQAVARVPGRGEPRRPARPPAVGARAARAARPRLLVVCREQGRRW